MLLRGLVFTPDACFLNNTVQFNIINVLGVGGGEGGTYYVTEDAVGRMT